MTITDDRLARYGLHAAVCRVLTDPKRLMLIDALRTGERSVGALAEAIGIGLPNASQHLAILRGAGLVVGRHVGTSVVYRLAEPSIVDACDVIDRIVGRRLAAHPAGPADPKIPTPPPPAVQPTPGATA